MATETTPKVQTKVLNSSDPSLPPLVLQIIQMVDTYMLWIGAADGNTNVGNGENAVLNGNLCKDWACAMPPRLHGDLSAATSLFRSANSDIALPMAQRLGKGPHCELMLTGNLIVDANCAIAKRFQKQIFLSVDIPSGFLTLGQGQQLALEAEKGIVATLKEVEKTLARRREAGQDD